MRLYGAVWKSDGHMVCSEWSLAVTLGRVGFFWFHVVSCGFLLYRYVSMCNHWYLLDTIVIVLGTVGALCIVLYRLGH